MTAGKLTWRFRKTFWIANVTELFERAAYYGCFIFLTVYLTKRVGFTDVETGYVIGVFSFLVYFMPTIMGTLADRIGFRSAICLAFGLLAIGYAILGAWPTKPVVIVALMIILLGAATVKPVVSGTVAKCSDEVNRARAFSLFYWAVNIGSFTGKSLVDPIRQVFTGNEPSGFVASVRSFLHIPLVEGSEYQFINLYSASMALIALVLAFFAYKNVSEDHKSRGFGDIFTGLKKVLTNWRFLCLIIITGLFWSIQGQLYATMPKYLFRMVGEFTKPGWMANVNPFVVVIFVIPITHLVHKWKPISSIAVSFRGCPSRS